MSYEYTTTLINRNEIEISFQGTRVLGSTIGHGLALSVARDSLYSSDVARGQKLLEKNIHNK